MSDPVGRLHIRIDDELHQRAKSRAALVGQTLQEYVEEALAEKVGADERVDRRGARATDDG
jgi:predicted HicB family RNase H-like nuclease